MILPKGTAYQTDAGMCGDYDSVIGMDKALPIARFTRKLPTERLSAAQGPGTLCAVFVETDDKTGLARRDLAAARRRQAFAADAASGDGSRLTYRPAGGPEINHHPPAKAAIHQLIRA